VKFTFVLSGIESMFPKMSEDFPNMFAMFVHVLGVDKDVIQVD